MDAARWQRVKAIAADALELEGDARARRLDQACGSDVALRSEVERLVAAGTGPDSLLDLTTRGSTGAAEAPDTLQPARTIPALRSGATPVPADFMERGASRLSTLALIYASGFVLAYALFEVSVHFIVGDAYVQRPHTPGQIMAGIFILLSFGVHLIASRRRLSPDALLRLGLGFEVVGSLGIALVSYSVAWDLEKPVWGVSWICVWIMMYPLVIPAPPRASGIAAFAAAAMGPVALLAWGVTREFSFPPPHILIATTAPNFVCAALAWFGSRYIYRIGLELREAKRLGRYRLVRPLGRGGMGEVWIAEHDMLARPAALKLVRPELLYRRGLSADLLSRFEREAQSIAALTSPHTVNLYDFGVTGDGVFYYVMELLDGLDLHTLVRRHGPVAPARAVHILRQACASLAEAHARGLVHRDVKPSNLMVCRQGLAHDFVKVLDFGIVRAHAETVHDGDAARIEGTPGYLAPEAAHGAPPDPRADLYALGCVGYWLLTGRPVFSAGSDAEAMQRHAEDAPEPPSRRVDGIPPALDALILDCLAKSPAARPADAAALSLRLARIGLPAWEEADARAWWETSGAG